MQLDLNGKNALIGGSSAGLGLASAIELSLLGATVTLVSRDEQKLLKAMDTLDRSRGQNHSYIVCDYSKPKEAVEAISNDLEAPVHILVNNSGGPPAGPVTSLQADDYLKGFEMHFRTTHDLCMWALPAMQAEGFGRIVNILSISVYQPIDELPVSNMLRSGISSWAKTLSNKIADSNITVNNVLPGYTMTDRMRYLFDKRKEADGLTEEQVTGGIIAQIPAGRFAEPSEVGAAVAFLCTPAASYINGVNLPVDGGWLKGNH